VNLKENVMNNKQILNNYLILDLKSSLIIIEEIHKSIQCKVMDIYHSRFKKTVNRMIIQCQWSASLICRVMIARDRVKARNWVHQ